jgi:hypothetical protein
VGAREPAVLPSCARKRNYLLDELVLLIADTHRPGRNAVSRNDPFKHHSGFGGYGADRRRDMPNATEIGVQSHSK